MLILANEPVEYTSATSNPHTYTWNERDQHFNSKTIEQTHFSRQLNADTVKNVKCDSHLFSMDTFSTPKDDLIKIYHKRNWNTINSAKRSTDEDVNLILHSIIHLNASVCYEYPYHIQNKTICRVVRVTLATANIHTHFPFNLFWISLKTILTIRVMRYISPMPNRFSIHPSIDSSNGPDVIIYIEKCHEYMHTKHSLCSKASP